MNRIGILRRRLGLEVRPNGLAQPQDGSRPQAPSQPVKGDDPGPNRAKKQGVTKRIGRGQFRRGA